MTSKENEVWIPVPGFSDYEVSSDGRARSLKWGKCVQKKLKGKSLIGNYRSDCGTRFYSSWVRMYYCALHGINPLDLKGKDVFISMEHGEFKVEGKEKRIQTLQGIRAYRLSPLDMEEVSQRYEFCKEVCDAILEYYETGNGGRIERMIHSIKEEVKWYMYNTLRVYNPEMREEVFSQSVEQFFKTLQERKRTIYGLRPFFYKSARYIMMNMRKRKRKEISKKEEFLEYRDFHASF